jgi:hypothetical protein
MPDEVHNGLGPCSKLPSQRLFPAAAEKDNTVAFLAERVHHCAEIVRPPPFLEASTSGVESNPGGGLGKELACTLAGLVGNGIKWAQGTLGDTFSKGSQEVEIGFNAVAPFGSGTEIVEDAGSIRLRTLWIGVFKAQPRTAHSGKKRMAQSVAGLCAEEDVCSETPAAPESKQQGSNPKWGFGVAYQFQPWEGPENRR